MEKNLLYVSRTAYAVGRTPLPEKSTVDRTQNQHVAFSEAEVNFYLGDLLAHQHRSNAEQLAACPFSSRPTSRHAYRAMRIHAGRYNEAQKYLIAITNDPAGQNYLLYYYQAMALMRTGAQRRQTAVWRQCLIHSRRISFATACNGLLPLIRLSRFLPPARLRQSRHRQQLEETVALLKRILTIVPGKQELLFQPYSFTCGRKSSRTPPVAEALTRQTVNPTTQQSARALLWQITQAKEIRYARTFYQVSQQRNYPRELARSARLCRSNRPFTYATAIAAKRCWAC
ncbi:MAG: hypothetical protein U0Y68_25440 [Blastocatellia bacterium]